MKKATIYIDGASRGNPGPASVGVVFVDSKNEVLNLISKRLGTATNNIAEYSALIIALQAALIEGYKEVDVFTDSELLAKQFSGEYKIKEDTLKVLFLFVSQLRQGFKKVTVSHVPRERNKLADQAANKALDEQMLF